METDEPSNPPLQLRKAVQQIKLSQHWLVMVMKLANLNIMMSLFVNHLFLLHTQAPKTLHQSLKTGLK